MDKVKITREQQYNIQNWLNERSRRIAKESDVAKKTELHVQYTAVLKFIQEYNGEVIYSAKHCHKVKLESLPKEISFKKTPHCGVF